MNLIVSAGKKSECVSTGFPTIVFWGKNQSISQTELSRGVGEESAFIQVEWPNLDL